MADDVSTYRLAVVDLLKSRGSDTWSDAELDSAIRLALMDLSQRLPRSLSAEVTVVEPGRRISLADLGDCLWVEEVWWPYVPGQSAGPPAGRRASAPAPFEVRDGSLSLFTIAEPQAGDTVRVLYAGRHTIAGLDEAAATTVASEWRGIIAIGTAGYAAAAKAAAMAREYSWPTGAAKAMRDWSGMMLSLFDARLKAVHSPAALAWVTWG
jgi:hypothetical protein